MRTIREEVAVQEAVDDACERWERAMDAWETITWAVIRDPTVGEPLSETGTARAFTVDGGRSIDMPTVTILYEIQPELIVIHAAQFRDADATYVGRA